MTESFRQDIEAMYIYAAQCDNLDAVIASLCGVFQRNGDALTGVTASYRLVASDTGYTVAFALTQGRFATLGPTAPVDVTVTGREATLMAIFQRKLNPVTAMLLHKIRIDGSKAALMAMADFL